MKTILVFEDDPTQARLVERVLEYAGYRVVIALNGEQGLQLALANVPDLILLDMGLPDIDGQTVAGLIRGSSMLSNVPLVAVTAWPEDIAEEMARAYGCDGYFSKPIKVREFADQVAQYFKN
jgi:two-component system cell cycle response regulator DivK